MFQQPLFQYALWRMPRTVNFAPGEVGLRSVSPAGQQYGIQRLPTDPVGTTSVTFEGVPAGNEIRVYDQDLNELAGVETCTANQILTWAVYVPGSPKNNVQIKIFGIDYKIKDFPYTSRVGDQTVPVQMDTDPWK